MKNIGLSIILTLMLSLLGAGTGLAQEPTQDEINAIAKDLSCPTCAGINLSDCRTQTCNQWKEQIGDLLAEGYTEQEVLDYFSTRYGVQVLQEPPRSGFTLSLWVLPVIILLLGAVWLGLTLRKWAQPAPVETPAEPLAPGDYLSRVDADLRDETP